MLMEDKIIVSPFFSQWENSHILLDPLTKALNRQYIFSYAKFLIEEKKPFLMGILDVDNFKTINDNYGHAVGDEILRGVADNIMKALPDNAWLGRYGGDEFFFLIEDCATYDEGWTIIKRLFVTGTRERIKVRSDLSVQTTCTCGAAIYPKDGTDFEYLFEMCDKCLYRGKEKGRNCFILFVEEKHRDIIIKKVRNESQLEKARALVSEIEAKGVLGAGSVLAAILNLSGMTVWEKDRILFSYERDQTPRVIPPEYLSFMGDYYKLNDVRSLDDTTDYYRFCRNASLLSFICMKITDDVRLLVYDAGFERIWQDKEETMLCLYAQMLRLALKDR